MDEACERPARPQRWRRSRTTRETRRPVRSTSDRGRNLRRPNGSAAPGRCSAARDRGEPSVPGGSWLYPCSVLVLAGFGTESEVVDEETDQSSDNREITQPL